MPETPGYRKALTIALAATRFPAGHRTPDTGHRTPDTGHRTPYCITTPTPERRPTRLVLLTVLALLVSATFAHLTHAQVVDYSLPPAADLSIDIQTPSYAQRQITVTNNRVGSHPTVEVGLVKVRIVEDDIKEGTRTTTWTVRNLKAGQSERNSLYATTAPRQGDERQLVPLRLHAEIIETEPVEPPGYQFNNAADHWYMAVWPGSSLWLMRHTNGDAGVDFDISDRFPQAGGRTTFTVKATNSASSWTDQSARNNQVQFDIQVRISLSPGLTFTATQAPPTNPDNDTGEQDTTFNVDTDDPNTGIWDVGTLELALIGTVALDFPVSVNLTSDSLADLPLKQRCLTAEVVRAVPWFKFDPSKRDNDIRTVCLGDAPKVLVTGGDFTLFDFYPCVGVTGEPCTSVDTLELLATTPRPNDHFDVYGISQTGDSFDSGTILQPEAFTVQVWGRDDIVGGTEVWSTDNEFDLEFAWKRLLARNWTSWEYSLIVTAPDGEDPPGSFKMNFTLANSLDREITDTTKVTVGPYTIFGTRYTLPLDLEFGNLGTYALAMGVKGVHKTAGTLTDSRTYTFHVGPVADLEVRDAGASPEVAGSQHAYTIEAENKGPQTSPDVAVTLTGVPEDAEAFPNEGSYAQGTCQGRLCTGVWTIGELKLSRRRHADGLPPNPTLTLVTASGGDPITATIESTEDYEEVINGATQSGDYHDYDEGNNTVTAMARAGTATGEGAPGAPRSLSVQRFGGIAVLSWDEVARVHGHPVTHYHVERNGIILVEDVMDDVYVDFLDVNQPYRTYRVRAVNQFGVPGPWSGSAGGAMPQGPPAPTGFTATPSEVIGRIVLSWFAPSNVDGLRYRIEHSLDGGDPWTVLSASQPGLTYVHDRLAPASTQYYRVATVKDGLTSSWSFAQATTKTEPGALASLTATAGRGVGRIDLSWYPPFAVGNLRYRIEHAADRAGPWTVLSAGFNGLTYSHHSLSPGTTYYYRVAVVQDGITGAWTYAHATTEALPVVDEQGVTVNVVHYAPLWPENLRFSSVDRTSVTLVWDPPVDDGGTPVTGYEYQVSGPCPSGADAVCDIVAPTRVSGTSVRVSGLNREGFYQFEVRALNAAGASDWSLGLQKEVGPATAGGGRVILSPTRLTVPEGGEATYRVKLSRSPTQPLWVILHWEGDEDLGGGLPFEQFKVLLPSGYDTSSVAHATCRDFPYGYDWDGMAHAWNVGVPITVAAAEDDDSANGRLTILHDIYTMPEDCLGNPDGYEYDPVFDGISGLALEVTERDND